MIKTIVKKGRTYAKLADLVGWKKNPRTISEEDFVRLKQQIAKLGVYKPLLCTKDGVVLGGNMRLKAMGELGVKEVWVNVVEAKSETQMLEYALSDNDRAGSYSEDELAALVRASNIDLVMFKVDLADPVLLVDLLDLASSDDDSIDADRFKVLTIVPPESPRLKDRITFRCETRAQYEELFKKFGESPDIAELMVLAGGGQVRLFSLFSGIGGLDFGLMDRAELVGFSEIKESSVRVFERHFGGRNYGDITKIEPADLPDFDILTGGFPCQSFSLMGLRKGLVDPRGKMIFHIYNMLLAKKPRFFVLENVKGLLTHNKGKTFARVMRLLTDAGYKVRVLLLNAAHYGSAQSRERLLFLGCVEDFPAVAPEKVDDAGRFRDVREEGGRYKFLTESEFNLAKLHGGRKRTFEVIGGYDRVGALLTSYGCGEKVVYDEGSDWFRFLTPTECERLQGFPDGFTEGLKDSDRYFALGNAVNCDMSRYLFGTYLKGLWW